ncbi:MAG: tripartite tricarboxylate transporter TctB family protein [Thermodesulfobacteriota bacterium]|nr:tripartite tricarboxylate transporter TctB family protein [Thermodesulfobacteriota bacterium]
MRKIGDIFASIFFICVGIGFMIGAIGLRVGKPTEPQPGFFPFLGGIVLVLLSGILLFQAWHRGRGEPQALGKLWGPATVILGLIAYVATLDSVGYLITITMLSAIVLRVLQTKSLWVLTVTSLILAISSYILFDRLLGVPLPSGILARFW